MIAVTVIIQSNADLPAATRRSSLGATPMLPSPNRRKKRRTPERPIQLTANDREHQIDQTTTDRLLLLVLLHQHQEGQG